MYKNQVRGGGGGGCDLGFAETDPSGRYSRFRDVLGKGAMKTVYRAFDEVVGMEVAWNQVKLNDVFRSPDELHRLYSEVHLLKNLNHESIIKFYASWIDVEKRTFNFVTEMFTSGTLREYRQRYQRVDIRAVKNWARQILRGITYLHAHDPPVIHRDLKCDNIFVNGHLGQVKIGDLGLAAILRDSQHAHSVIGTPEFMAPELYEEEYNELVDVYSFGMCMLEMLTSEYPYSECSNPAQIYKKVTSGKLPKAYHRIEDLEARKFVGKCLENVSKRPSAQDLLNDPFLATNESEVLPIPIVPNHESDPNETDDELPADPNERNTDRIITGSMRPGVDNTIFLKVHLSNLGGRARNVYFPFCILSDTPIDVATEMVSELDIVDWDPYELAMMIEEEVLSLVPDWNYAQRCSFSFHEDEYDGSNPPFYAASSSSSPHGTQFLRENIAVPDQSWLLEGLFALDDTSSQSSLNSHNYSNANYSSGDEDEYDPTLRVLPEPVATTRNYNSTRFCPAESVGAKQDKINRNLLADSHHRSYDHRSNDGVGRKMTRMRSMMDVRSQLLHRSLVEEISKRRLFKTVGSVENIGFQEPCGSRSHEKVRYKW